QRFTLPAIGAMEARFDVINVLGQNYVLRRHRGRDLRPPVRTTPRILRGREEGVLMDLSGFVAALRVGGAMIYPLLLLAVIAVVVILEKAFVFSTRTRLPAPVLEVL